MDTTRDTHGIRTLLVPLDGTEFSRTILDQARDLFTPDRFRIALLHVAEPPTARIPPYRPAAVGPDYTLYAYEARVHSLGEWKQGAHEPHELYDADVDDDFRKRLELELERELALFQGEGYEASATVHFGEPAEEIAAFARDETVAVIAMATHGRRGLGRLLQGSVAVDVLDRLDRPVPLLLLKPDEQQPSADGRAMERAGEEDADGTRASAILAELHGIGSLTVQRREDGSLEEATGTFAPTGHDVDLSPLRDAQRHNLAVTYDGPVFEPDEGRERVRKTKVFITRIREAEAAGSAEDSPEPAWIEFTAGEVVDGDLVTKSSELRV